MKSMGYVIFSRNNGDVLLNTLPVELYFQRNCSGGNCFQFHMNSQVGSVAAKTLFRMNIFQSGAVKFLQIDVSINSCNGQTGPPIPAAGALHLAYKLQMIDLVIIIFLQVKRILSSPFFTDCNRRVNVDF